MRIAVARLTNGKGGMLVVRKAGTLSFMQPGGKIENGEEPLATLVRELHEELGLNVCPAQVTYLGEAEADAANEPGERVIATVFALCLENEVTGHAEIAEVRWIDPLRPGDLPLAPLTRDSILSWEPT